jgi:hypothetical protein
MPSKGELVGVRPAEQVRVGVVGIVGLRGGIRRVCTRQPKERVQSLSSIVAEGVWQRSTVDSVGVVASQPEGLPGQKRAPDCHL